MSMRRTFYIWSEDISDIKIFRSRHGHYLLETLSDQKQDKSPKDQCADVDGLGRVGRVSEQYENENERERQREREANRIV
jgi:hypothetical protein